MQTIQIEENTLRRLLEAGSELADDAENNGMDDRLIDSWDRAWRDANHAMLEAVSRQASGRAQA